ILRRHADHLSVTGIHITGQQAVISPEIHAISPISGGRLPLPRRPTDIFDPSRPTHHGDTIAAPEQTVNEIDLRHNPGNIAG
ncbi:hypothetical protein, partial [Enterococcus faecalis]|uniref:hypothetical protein n=1 Tax=Enterococcus faecalis TaxID=1351 RepID=UPI00403F1BBA